MAMIPSYISRSVAGSFDLEGVAIFALVYTFYLYVKVSQLHTVAPSGPLHTPQMACVPALRLLRRAVRAETASACRH